MAKKTIKKSTPSARSLPVKAGSKAAASKLKAAPAPKAKPKKKVAPARALPVVRKVVKKSSGNPSNVAKRSPSASGMKAALKSAAVVKKIPAKSASASEAADTTAIRPSAVGKPGSKRPIYRSEAQRTAIGELRERIGQQRKQSLGFAIESAQLADDLHCEDVVLIDVTGYSPSTDFIIIASGSSDRQMRTCAEQVRDLGRKQNHSEARIEADDRATWIVCDAADVILHVFEPNTRAHYDLESMWPDAKRIDWKR